MEIRGKVHEIGNVIQVTDSFKKRELVLAYSENPQFVEYITLQSVQDRVTIFDNLRIGQDISVDFNLKGRPWTNKDGQTTYFNTLVAWRITPLSTQPTQPAAHNYGDLPAMNVPSDTEDDDLPF